MKRLLKYLAQLYPSAWRKRYGVEYEALLDQGTPHVRDALDVLWSAVKMHAASKGLRRIVLPCAIAGVLSAAAISFAVPPQYVSQTVISLTTRSANPKVDTQSSAEASLHEVMNTLLSDASLAPIIQKLNLYQRERTRMSQEELIQRMRKDIYLKPLTHGPGESALALQFSYPDPHIAQQVDTELVSAALSSALRSRINHASLRSDRQELFRVETQASLPQAPSFPKRKTFAACGLFAGIAGGLLLAAVMRRHRARLPT